jgi:hypothetical protein
VSCPFFAQRGHHCRCLAVREEQVPALFQREVFCTTGRHASCPSFEARLRQGRPLSEAEYLRQWSGGAPARSAPGNALVRLRTSSATRR